MNFQTVLTRILKTLAVVALITLATFLVLAEIGLQRSDGHATWHFHVGAGIAICFCVCAAYLLIRPPRDSAGQIYCSKCRTLGGHTEITPYRGSVSRMDHHFGGALLSVFHAASRKQRFRCHECSTEFEAHSGTSRAYQLLYVMMVAFIVNSVWSKIAEFWAE